MTPSGSLPLRSLVVPAVITFVITLLRLTGELMGGPRRLFGDATGGGALVGIVWLVPVFGVYFAWKLAREGSSAGAGRTVAHALAAVVLVMGAGALAGLVLRLGQYAMFGVIVLAGLAAAGIAYRGWPALGRTLLVYGLLARIPVALVMLAAVLAGWRTHYNSPPPDFPAMAPLAKWFFIGFIPQMFLWIPFTILVGTLAGGLALTVLSRRRPPARA
jgi:hypothetical protein